MRGEVVYHVYGIHAGREDDVYFCTRRTQVDAEAEVAELQIREMNGKNWAAQYHNRGFVIREDIVQIDFEVPTRPKPRDRYFVRCHRKENQTGTWPSSRIEIFERQSNPGESKKICEYERNYGPFQTFEPFRQGDREFALISLDYTGTAVLDLRSGEVIAEEKPSSAGFCPVGFYVPDWWDLYDGTCIPGSKFWSVDHEFRSGEFGFVWGCVWGDDSSWKVQHLDLRKIQEGTILRDSRFGYVELATDPFASPCFNESLVETAPGCAWPPFIRLERWEGKTTVTFAVEMKFNFASGQPAEWQRCGNSNFE